MADNIDSNADVLDVRDIIERFEELETELQERHEQGGFMSAFDDWINNSRDNSNPIYAAFKDDGAQVQEDIEEFYHLRELLDDLRGYGGDYQWNGAWYPVTLIADSYFQDYAQELAEDTGAINRGAGWPTNCIDWERAARGLQMDYSQTVFHDSTFWYR